MIKSILIIDFGSQYTHLIGRKIRELGLFCEIKPPKYLNSLEILNNHEALILSGGPDSVLSKKSPSLKINISQITLPILGICYGSVSYTHLRAHETLMNLVCRLPLKKNFFNDTATTEIYT